MLRVHIHWLMTLRAPLFVIVLVCYDFLARTLVNIGIALVPAEFEYGNTFSASVMLGQKGLPLAVIEVVFLAPFVETIFLQWIPIMLAEFFTDKWYWLMIASVALFSLTHISATFPILIVIVIGGIILAFSFLCWRRIGLWRSIWITTAIHSLSNGISLILALT